MTDIHFTPDILAFSLVNFRHLSLLIGSLLQQYLTYWTSDKQGTGKKALKRDF